MPNFTLIIICLFFTVSNLVVAQKKELPDYIINHKGDTIKCEIKDYSAFRTNIKYRTDSMENFEKIDSANVKQYFLHKKKRTLRLVMLPEEKKPLYTELIEEGKINLYVVYVSVGGGGSSADYYVTKGNNALQLIKTGSITSSKNRSERKTIFTNMIADNAVVLEQFKIGNSYSFDLLKNIIHFYNTGELLKKTTDDVNEYN